MIHITAATENQLADILALDRQHSRVFSTTAGYQHLLGQSGLLLVAVKQELVQGFAAFSRVLDEASLLNLIVQNDMRRQGVARLLLRDAWRQLRTMGARRVLLELRESNEAARLFYESEGFTHDTVRPRYYPMANGQRETALLMSRLLEI
ncbi:MAG: GNAT family N-acetyltransferase [Congregibacter sp.]